MAKCFVIQPFDKGGPYDKRYDDVLKPAIKEANLDFYPVDQDPSVAVLIDDIENGIRESEICLADITTNNPNIWYEVGFAFANGKRVVLICADPRPESYPFDIKHRYIINYMLHSSSDFDKLKSEITARLKAQAEKAETMQTVAALSEIQTTEGLSAHEIAALIIISERTTPDSGITPYEIKENMRKSGYTKIAVTIGLGSLLKKGMIEYFKDMSPNEGNYTACRLTPRGLTWMLDNQGRFRMRIDEDASSMDISDDDIPF